MEKMNLNIGTDSFDGQDEMSYFDSFSRNDTVFRGRYDKIREKCMELVEKDLDEKMGNWAKGLNILQAAYDKDGGQRTAVLVGLRKAKRYLQEFGCRSVDWATQKEFCSAAEGTINDPGTADTVTDGAEGNADTSWLDKWMYVYDSGFSPLNSWINREVLGRDNCCTRAVSIRTNIFIQMEKRHGKEMVFRIKLHPGNGGELQWGYLGILPGKDPKSPGIPSAVRLFTDNMYFPGEDTEFIVLSRDGGEWTLGAGIKDFAEVVTDIMMSELPQALERAGADLYKDNGNIDESFEDSWEDKGDDGTYFDTFSRSDAEIKQKYEKLEKTCRAELEHDLMKKAAGWGTGLNIIYNGTPKRRAVDLWTLNKARPYLRQFDCFDGNGMTGDVFCGEECVGGKLLRIHNPNIADDKLYYIDKAYKGYKRARNFAYHCEVEIPGDRRDGIKEISLSGRIYIWLEKENNDKIIIHIYPHGYMDRWRFAGKKYWMETFAGADEFENHMENTVDENPPEKLDYVILNKTAVTKYPGGEEVDWKVNEEEIRAFADAIMKVWSPYLMRHACADYIKESFGGNFGDEDEETYFDTFSKDDTEYNEWIGAALDSAKKYMSMWKWWDWYKDEPKDYSQHNYDEILCDADFIGYAKYVFSYCFWQGWSKEDLEDAKIVSDGHTGINKWSNGQFIWNTVRDETLFWMGQLYMKSISKEERDRLYYYTNSRIVDTAKNILTLVMNKFREFNIDGTQLDKKELNESKMEMMNLFDKDDFGEENDGESEGNYFDAFNQEQTKFRDEWMDWYDKHNGAIAIIKNDPGFSNAQWIVGERFFDDEPSILIKTQFKRAALKYVLSHRDPDHYIRPQHTYNKDICDDDIINISKIFFSFLCWLCLRADVRKTYKLRSDPASKYLDCWYTTPMFLEGHHCCLTVIQGMLHGICDELSAKGADGYNITNEWQKKAWVYYYAQYAVAFIPFVIYNIYAYESKMAYKNIKTYKLDKEDHAEDKYYWNSLIDNFGDPKYGNGDDNMSDIYKAVWNIVREHFDTFMEYVMERCKDKENNDESFRDSYGKRIIIYK